MCHLYILGWTTMTLGGNKNKEFLNEPATLNNLDLLEIISGMKIATSTLGK